MTHHLSRRNFIARSSIVTLAFAGLHSFVSAPGRAASVEDLDKVLESDFYGTIDLPAGFRYVLCSETGEKMDHGTGPRLELRDASDGKASFGRSGPAEGDGTLSP